MLLLLLAASMEVLTVNPGSLPIRSLFSGTAAMPWLQLLQVEISSTMMLQGFKANAFHAHAICLGTDLKGQARGALSQPNLDH